MSGRLGGLFSRGPDTEDEPPADLPAEPDFGEPIVRLDGVSKHFPAGGGTLGSLSVDLGGDGSVFSLDRERVRAVDDVSFDVRRGETLGLVGESGCGKSTLARTVLRLVAPTEGRIYFKGQDVAAQSASDMRDLRSEMQMIFQDPQSSLDPRMKVGPIVEEPMRAHGMLDPEGREARARDLLAKVGLDPQHYNRYPHAFSGGQRQRINLARALSVNPDFIVCDEPVSALDVSIQAQVLNTMRDLQAEFGLTYLFIAHDLSVVRHVSDRVAVMYLGHVVELADREELFENPQHPYTESLLASIPVPDPRASGERGVLAGEVPSPIDPPSGCRFHTRCPKLIAPPGLDLNTGEWDAVREFVRAVDRHEFAADDPDSVRRRFFGDVEIGGEAGETVADAIQDAVDGRWDAAAGRLTDTFVEPSVCARERPDYAVEPEYGDSRHFAACHLHREEPGTR